MTDLRQLKAAVDLRAIVNETHPIGRTEKICCLWHDDTCPSLHIYRDGYICYGCGSYGDHISWLRQVRDLSMSEAVLELERYAGATHFTPMPVHAPGRRSVALSPLTEQQLRTHGRRAARLHKVPYALLGRGFTPADCRRLEIAGENGDAVFPITGPSGEVLALKRRYVVPKDGKRYDYVTPGRGAPAWCSPGIQDAETVWVIEGELNGMACWLALEAPSQGVMGISGSGGALHAEVLGGKTIYIYADGDEVGGAAGVRWANDAVRLGAASVHILEPWRMDACEVAGRFGRAALHATLLQGTANATPFDAARLIDARTGASKQTLPSPQQPHLMQSCSVFQSLPIGASQPPNLLS